MQPIQPGMMGVGQIGTMHLREYAQIPGAQIVAAADINEAELQRVAEEYRIPYKTSDFRELLQREDIDAVDVCLHNNHHAPVTIEVLHAGKHVYCEKPMAGAYVDSLAMYKRRIALAKSSPSNWQPSAPKRTNESPPPDHPHRLRG